MLCKRRAFSSVCSSQRGEVWKRSPVWGSVPSSSCLWPRSAVQKSTANDLRQEMGIHEGRRRKEPYPLLLRKFSWMYIDVAVLLQRIFTADKTMDVDVSHPAGLLKDKYCRTPGQHKIFLCHHLLLFCISQSGPWPVTATFLLSPWHSAPSLKGVTADVKFRSRHYLLKVSFNAAGFGCPPVRTHCMGPRVHFCECCPPSHINKLNFYCFIC